MGCGNRKGPSGQLLDFRRGICLQGMRLAGEQSVANRMERQRRRRRQRPPPQAPACRACLRQLTVACKAKDSVGEQSAREAT